MCALADTGQGVMAQSPGVPENLLPGSLHPAAWNKPQFQETRRITGVERQRSASVRSSYPLWPDAGGSGRCHVTLGCSFHTASHLEVHPCKWNLGTLRSKVPVQAWDWHMSSWLVTKLSFGPSLLCPPYSGQVIHQGCPEVQGPCPAA